MDGYATSSDKDFHSCGRSLCGSGLHVNGNQKLLDTRTPISVSSVQLRAVFARKTPNAPEKYLDLSYCQKAVTGL